MNNFNENNQGSVAEFVLNNLNKHNYFALATVDKNNNPWVVCLNLAFDRDINVIWKSQKNTEHSNHIRNRPNVSICVFSSTEDNGDFGFYTNATAREVTNKEELEKILDIRYKDKGKRVPPIDDFLDQSPTRIYVAEISEAWVNDDRHIKAIIDLDILRKLAKSK